MQLRRILLDLARAIADQAERDPEFARRISEALGMREQSGIGATTPRHFEKRRPKNRRPSAVLDPIAIARDGAVALRARLSDLSLEQLRDVVADYGMDPGKLVMKWKDPEKVIDRIIDMALARVQKGDAFRSE